MFYMSENDNIIAWINDNTVSTIHCNENGKAVLRLYKNKAVIFEKEYKNMQIAKAQETKRLNKNF